MTAPRPVDAGRDALSRYAMRVGVDVASVDAVARSIDRFGERYLDRVFTAHERASCVGATPRMAAALAGRFAAKEAAIKVLRPDGVATNWKSIEVRRHPGGWCDLRLEGAARELAEEAGIDEMAVSITHEGHVAAAVVLARCVGSGVNEKKESIR